MFAIDEIFSECSTVQKPEESAEEYVQALASTRQAVAVLKAIGFMHACDTARYVEAS